MPHIILEFSSNLLQEVNNSRLLQNLHKIVTDSGVFSVQAVKARQLEYKDYILPQGTNNFIHVTIAILTGKDLNQRKKLSQDIFGSIKNLISCCDKISVEIRQMDIDSYCK